MDVIISTAISYIIGSLIAIIMYILHGFYIKVRRNYFKNKSDKNK